ncbi:MAG: HAMP domain-containing sensor histidine kinase [Bacteroidota bacterium]
MSLTRSALFVWAASLALIALILFQVHWMYHSQKLIEEQFDQRVSMALCSAMDQLKNEQSNPAVWMVPKLPPKKSTCSSPKLDLATLDRTVTLAMERYGIALDFRLKLAEDSTTLPFCRKTYCTPLDPQNLSAEIVHLEFQGKRAYVWQELGLMALAAIILLLCVSGFFATALFKLWQQKKLHRESIDFFDNMAHEFRTPLSNIQLALGIWERRMPEIEENRYHRVIKQESQQLLEQVDLILQFSQLSQEAYPMRLERVDLHEFLHEEIGLAQLWVKERSGSITLLESSEAMPLLNFDRLHLRNVLRNLWDNALKYGQEEAQIEVSYGIEKGQAFISVWDNGEGLSQDEFVAIGEKFKRSGTDSLNRESGFGLGLYYVQKVIELHQGEFRLGQRKSWGTEFQLIFPIK